MTMAIHFDTLRYVEKLKSAGVPEPQAKAEAEALLAALGESASANLASKEDITQLKLDQADIKSDLKLIKWMVATVIAGIISIVIKTFF